MSQTYERQREHLREWATKHIVECDALVAALLKNPFSTVIFADRKALRFAGSLPDGGHSPLPYSIYFYPKGHGSGVKVAEMKGNLFVYPYKVLTSINKPGVLAGVVLLYIEEDKEGKRYVATGVSCETPDGTKFYGKHYLFTLPPRSRPLIEGGDAQETIEEHPYIGFLPVAM